MKFYSTDQIRQKWINFFKQKLHQYVEAKSLIPVNDPSLLWINSGVATLKDYFSGLTIPPNRKIVNCQPSIRTNDIENVGFTSRHHTIFEMLGFFSIGDYFKEKAIELGYELLVKEFEIPLEKLYITVFKDDEIACKKWIELGIIKSHIVKCDKDRNFWDVGQGPCGPCTEVFFDRGIKYDPSNIGEKLFFEDLENDRYIEIGNIVFSQYNNDGANNYTELAQKNIDTGWGLERWACVFQDVPTNFDSDCYQKVIQTIMQTCNKKYEISAYFDPSSEKNEVNRLFRIIADHLKTCVFAISDGAVFSNKDRGSILRRLLRRAMVCANKLGCDKTFITLTANSIINVYSSFFPKLSYSQQQINEILEKERKLFETTIEKGIKLFQKETFGKKTMDAEVIFKLMDTYGFPYEIIKELCEQNSISFNQEAYFSLVEKHRKISKANVENKGMSVQSPDLINFVADSEFVYDNFFLPKSKIIALFDEKFSLCDKACNKCWIVFDKTNFYATSGGQIHDEGIIQIGNIKYEVLDVIKTGNNQHLHLVDLDGNNVKVNDTASLSIDSVFRNNASSNHTAEHILEHVLNKNIDSSIKQEGAFKTDTYFTFDFKLNRKLSEKELELVEKKVNEIIEQSHDVCTTIKSHDEAINENTVGHFTEVYKKIKGGLRVVTIKGVNDEICGGTHVKNTKDIQKFMISEYFSKGTGLWRIIGITSNSTVSSYIDQEIEKYKILIDKIKEQIDEYKIKDKQLDSFFHEISYHSSCKNLIKLKTEYSKLKIYFDELLNETIKDMNKKSIVDIKLSPKLFSKNNNLMYFSVFEQNQKNIISALKELQNENSNLIFICFNIFPNKIQYIINCKPDSSIKANELIKKINIISNGNGGGDMFFAQGGSDKKDSLSDIIQLISDY